MADRNDIERLFRENYRKMYSLALALLKDGDSARDVVHDIFAGLLDVDTMPEIGAGYLMRAVRNRCVNLLRDMSARERIENLIRAGEPATSDDECWREREDRIAAIRSLIREKLPPQCSRAMRLRFEAGLPYKEIAREMAISEVAVYKHLKNGLDYIRKNLETD